MNYKVIIVGGGASGLLCAIELLRGQDALCAKDVLLLERNDRVGKKLIATGNGQGNLTNSQIFSENYHGDLSFINQFIPFIKDNQIANYLEELGIFLTSEDDGKTYPISYQASAVLDILRAHLENKGLVIKTNAYVNSLSKKEGKFIVKTDTESLCAQNVVMAVGGSVAKQFGTDGSSYKLIENFNHKLTQLYPSLVQIKTNTTDIKSLKGIKEYVSISLKQNNKVVAQEKGDLLFTDFGVSGDAIFRISSKLNGTKNAKLVVEFLPEYTEFEVEKLLEKARKTSPLYSENPFVCLLNKRVGQVIKKKANSLEPKVLAKFVKNFELEVVGSLGFNNAQVTKGGIDTKDIDAISLQSKLTDGLYVLGETLDIDGDCGGYNLTFAFYCGINSAKNIKNKFRS